MKTLNQFVTEARKSYLKVRSPDEQRFVDKHIVVKHQDNNGNKDDVFNASNVKTINRKADRHGYDPDDDEKVYEEAESLDENKQYYVTYNEMGDKNSKLLHNKNKPFASIGDAKDFIDKIAQGHPNRRSLGRIHTVNPETGRIIRAVNYDTHQSGYPYSPGLGDPKHLKDLKEEVEQVNEVLKPSMGAKAYIDDFIKSKNPKFSGDSKEQRRKRAIAAYYSDLRGEGLEINDSIIESLVDTFTQLSETNQESFIEMSESEDGINQLIDFIISNRGNE